MSGGQAMRFDVKKARAELATEAAPIAAPASLPFVAVVAIVATPPAGNPEKPPLPSAPATYPFGTSHGGHPRTWTGRIVNPAEWCILSDWERNGSTGQVWNGLTRQWETMPPNEGKQP